ncbi:hypothetical protein A6A08_09605 [Nocardiopsis sp. TSRI0078]|uniref:ABC transporter substrate-binding protein n=1 Tax=unclassified Nocardiopsis TaxID=2649073 RepID=UPI00093CAA80|nr:ABC transporter substrate-binding protein [Nocardiopsis sp. TSRI0078]OKI15803.1 hypothetical protein A6A08_09605 [Nocardiopsis sp. TSRI0078]
MTSPEPPSSTAPASGRRGAPIVGAVALTTVLIGVVAGVLHWPGSNGDGGDTVAWAPAGGSPPDVGEPAVTSPEPLRLGHVLPESPTGQAAAVALAVEEVNAVGGVLGHPLPDPVAGVETDPLKSADVASEVVAEDVHAVIGTGDPVGNGDVIPVVTGAGAVQCSASDLLSVPSQDATGLYFNANPSFERTTRALARTVADDGHRSVGVVVGLDPHSVLVHRALAKELEGTGVEIVVEDRTDPTEFEDPVLLTPDMAGAAGALLEQEVDAVVLGNPLWDEDLVSSLVEEGMTADRLYVTGHQYSLGRADDFQQASGRDLAGLTTVRPHTGSGDFHDFLGSTPGSGAAAAFDCVTIIALAAEAAGGVEPAGIAAHMPAVTSGGTPCAGYADCVRLLREGTEVAYTGPRGPASWDGDRMLATEYLEVVRHGGGSGDDQVEVRSFGPSD